MHVFQPLHLVRDYNKDPEGNVLIIDPYEDLPGYVPSEDAFSILQRVELHIPAENGSMWQTLGSIVDMDLDEGYQFVLLSVQIDWDTAAPLHEPAP